MLKLKPPHTHFLSAAQGWLELGNLAEARAELARIEPSLHEHPQVLDAQWAISAQAADWPAALAIAQALLRVAADAPHAWLHHAYALRRVPEGGLPAARDALQPALTKFPKVPLIPYNLACYACQMGNLGQARDLLRLALKTGDPKHIKLMALQDPDLQALWGEIPEL